MYYLVQTYVDGGLSTDDLGREGVQLGHILQGEGREGGKGGRREVEINSTSSVL